MSLSEVSQRFETWMARFPRNWIVWIYYADVGGEGRDSVYDFLGIFYDAAVGLEAAAQYCIVRFFKTTSSTVGTWAGDHGRSEVMNC